MKYLLLLSVFLCGCNAHFITNDEIERRMKMMRSKEPEVLHGQPETSGRMLSSEEAFQRQQEYYDRQQLDPSLPALDHD